MYRFVPLAFTLIACGGPQTGSALATITTLDATSACPEALRAAREEARGISDGARLDEIENAMRWALEHHEVSCRSTIDALSLWRDGLDALARIGTTDAQAAMAEALEQTHRPGSIHDRHNSTFREQTLAILEALSEATPLSPEAGDALLTWYGRGAFDCSNETSRRRVVEMGLAAGPAPFVTLAGRFPPMPEWGRCAPQWLVIDGFEGLDEGGRAQILERLAQSSTGALIRALEATRARGDAAATLTAALETRACQVAVERASLALEEEEDPRRAVEQARLLCPDGEADDDPLGRLLRATTAWLVSHEASDEAWAIVESIENATVEWRADVGGARIAALVASGELSEAAALLRSLEERGAAGEAALAAPVESLTFAIVAAAEAAIADDRLDEARDLNGILSLLENDPRPRWTRLGVLLALHEATSMVEVEGCPPEADRDRLDETLRDSRAALDGDLRGETELRQRAGTLIRRWGVFQRRCRGR